MNGRTELSCVLYFDESECRRKFNGKSHGNNTGVIFKSYGYFNFFADFCGST